MNRSDHANEDGVTLVEIVIYMTLSLFIATVVTYMLINTFKGQENVTSVTTATTRGQVAAQGLERAVRNSTDFVVSPDGATLTVATTLTPKCQGWRVVGDVLEISTTPGFAESTWRPLIPAGVLTLPDEESHVFGKEGTRLTYVFGVTTDSAPVTFTGQALPRAAGDSVSASCS